MDLFERFKSVKQLNDLLFRPRGGVIIDFDKNNEIIIP